MGLLALFGITNESLNLAVSLLLLFLVAIWLALIFWTYADARRRIEDPMLVGCAAAASLFPFVGTIVYMIVRPPEYLADVRERELEIAAAEARLSQSEHLHCPYCDFEIERSFLRCPSCLRRLKEPCVTCGKPLDPRWKICPYCESEIGQPAAQPRRVRRAASAEGAPERAASRPRAAPERASARSAPPPDRASGRAAAAPERSASRPAPARADRSGSQPGPSRPAERPSRPPARSPRPPARPEPPADGGPAESDAATRAQPRPDLPR
jgi:hypothetical protein